MQSRRARRAIAAAISAVTLGAVLAACAPEPPAAPTPPPSPAIVLPPPPGGPAVTPLDPSDAPDPFVMTVDPTLCVDPEPTPTTTTTTTAMPTTTSTTTTTTTVEPTTTTTTEAVVPTATKVAAVVPDACYYAFSTQVWIALFPVWRSTDLVHWTLVRNERVDANAMPDLAPWTAFGYHWAPAVVHRPANPADRRWVMWYTAREASTGLQCLGVATAAFPEGPYVDDDNRPAFCQRSLGGTIDASVFVDDDGTAYLTYKGGDPARLWVSTLTPDGLAVVPGTEHRLWQAATIAGDRPVVEAPTMVRVDGDLYLLYSTGDWSTADYRVGVATCDTVAGPCFAVYGGAVLASRDTMVGPGGQTPFRDADGDWWLLFHAWTAPGVGYPAGARSLHLLPLTLDGTRTRVG